MFLDHYLTPRSTGISKLLKSKWAAYWLWNGRLLLKAMGQSVASREFTKTTLIRFERWGSCDVQSTGNRIMSWTCPTIGYDVIPEMTKMCHRRGESFRVGPLSLNTITEASWLINTSFEKSFWLRWRLHLLSTRSSSSLSGFDPHWLQAH